MNVNIIMVAERSLQLRLTALSNCYVEPLPGGKRLDEETEQGKFFRITVLFESYHHIQMPFCGLGAIGSADVIPPGQIEAEITVGFPYNCGMMNPVHIGSHQEKTQPPIQYGGKFDVAVVEQGTCVQGYFKDQYSQCGSTKNDNRRHFDARGYGDFQRMETGAAGDIQIQVRVVHAVQAPQERVVVKQEVLKIDDEIEEDETEDNGQPERRVDPMKKPPTSRFGDLRHGSREDRKQEPERSGIDNRQRDVNKPAPTNLLKPGTPGCDNFPEGNQQKHSCENGKPYGLFSLHASVRTLTLRNMPVNAALAALFEKQLDLADRN